MDLMGGKSQDVELTSTALPARSTFWIVFMVTWTPETAGPAGKMYSMCCIECCIGFCVLRAVCVLLSCVVFRVALYCRHIHIFQYQIHTIPYKLHFYDVILAQDVSSP